MTLPQFVPPVNPTPQGTTLRVSPRARVVVYGDGYEQRAEDGLNSRPRSATLTWAALDPTDADTVIGFLSTNAVTGFRYAVASDSERQWKVDGDIETSFPDGDELRRVSVALREVFDP